MFKRTFKVGDTFTIKRGIIAGTNSRYALSRLNGGVVLLDTGIEKDDKTMLGGGETQTFTFLLEQPGEAEIQFVQMRGEHVLYEEVLPFLVVPKDANKVQPGGWSDFLLLDGHDVEIFQKAMQGLVGMNYTPVLVAKQVVNGMNYRFFCATKTVTEKPVYGFAMVNIYAERDKEPKLESILTY